MTDFIQIKQFSMELDTGTSSGKTGGFLAEGRHTVKIKEVVNRGPDQNDKSWIKLDLTVENDAGKKCYGQLLVPTSSNSYNAPWGPTFKEYNNLQDFVRSAYGTEVPTDGQAAALFLRKKFGEPQKLVGTRIEVEVGHPKGKYYAKKIDGAIKLTDGVNVKSEEFGDYTAANAFAEANGVKLSRFARVKGFVKRTVADDEPI